jgi:outer membrane protein OmpA-like peptidoglycan-associated protein
VKLAPKVSWILVMAFLMSCVTASDVRTKNQVLSEKLRKMDQAARICAPRELAKARANLEFAIYEASTGQPMRAARHLKMAELMTVKAYKRSRGSECERDRDLDGYKDSKDKCPTEPEDFDGDRDEDGCPEFDRDGDGIDDESDRCPDDKEDKDGFRDQDGCPDPDNDNDGIKDIVDQCPNKPEDKDGFEDLDGCPDYDNDKDGIPDVRDKCPNKREDFDGDRDEDGCPDAKKYKKIVVTKKRIQLKQKVFFQYNKAVILPKSFDLLNEVADALKDRVSAVVRIEGHTDSKGRKNYNKRLSQRRAQSVRTYLVEKGVKGSRLIAQGWGEERPRWSNKSRSGRDKNRRVEFHIISQ